MAPRARWTRYLKRHLVSCPIALQDRLRYFLFELLYSDGFDLTKATPLDRKDLLRHILAGLRQNAPIRFSDHLETDGPTMLAHACRFGLDGITVKQHPCGAMRTGMRNFRRSQSLIT
jgi:ATP-dependent DNA ligase